MKLYNSLTGTKEEFIPHGDVVKMYFCGPTVYKAAHIGNMRAMLVMDALRRSIKFAGYKLEGAMNITDVGHLVSDEDEGEDKIEKIAREEKLSPYQVAERVTKIFMSDVNKLNIDMPEHITKATDYVAKMIEVIKKIEAKGLTYKLEDGIYFDTQKYGRYGKLSNKDFSEKGVARVDSVEGKRHDFDFALWKFVPENHIMKWESPWGVGCPGWHIECTAMGVDKLGEHIDVHGGGIEHKYIHHENEIAQNYAAFNHDVVNVWAHNEHLLFNNGKMSKSLGNAYTISDLEEKGYAPLEFKYFSLLTHYRKPLNFTFEAMDAAKSALKSLKQELVKHKSRTAKVDVKKYMEEFANAVADDVNIPKAVGIMWSLLKEPASLDVYNAVLKMDAVLGLDLEAEEVTKEIPAEVTALAEERLEARRNKNYAESDRLRDLIKEKGYIVKDLKDAYELEKI